MKILFLAHRVPYPPNRGDRIRSYNLIRYLAKRAEVDLAYLTHEPVRAGTSEHLGRLCRRVTNATLHRHGRWINGVQSLLRGKTATEGLFKSAELQNTLANWSRDTRYDLVVAYCSSMAQYLNAPGLSCVPSIVDLVDVDSEKWVQLASQSRGPKRWLLATEGRRLRSLERSLVNPNQVVMLVSRAEADLLLRSVGADASTLGKQVHAVSNGVDLEYFRPDWQENDEYAESDSPPTAVFVGALDYSANIDAASWFCDKVWPEIRRHCPAARFQLVGSNPGRAIHRLQSVPGVDLIGPVPDIRPYLSRATLVTTPLRVARGIQNKVLEAMAMCKAIVSSPQALEGLHVQNGIHAASADTVSEWVSTVVQLFGDQSKRRHLGIAGRDYVEKHHCWDACLEPLDGIIDSICYTGNSRLTAKTSMAMDRAAYASPKAAGT